jgi:hypothetical protein
MRKCEGCKKDLDAFGLRWGVCMDCTRARYRAVMNVGRCVCRRADRRPRDVRTAHRSFTVCDRCLGGIWPRKKVVNG